MISITEHPGQHLGEVGGNLWIPGLPGMKYSFVASARMETVREILMKKDHVILGIHVTDRLRKAGEVQKVFTEYGRHIKTRLGLHEVADTVGNGEGVVLLEIVGG